MIGNSEYEQVGRLRNPVNDADVMTRMLNRLGFEVTTLRKADLRTMEPPSAVLERGCVVAESDSFSTPDTGCR